MWENSLEKLKILNYEIDYCKKLNKRPFSRIHFALPGSNAGHQFDDFTSICSWLVPIITGDNNALKSEQFEDPNTKLNKLMLVLRNLDFRGSFPAQKLRTPYGEPVCLVLEFLTDKALSARGFQFLPPQYPAMDEVRQTDSC